MVGAVTFIWFGVIAVLALLLALTARASIRAVRRCDAATARLTAERATVRVWHVPQIGPEETRAL